MSGSEIVADFISKFLYKKVFLVTGGACAFMVDAIGQHEEIEYIPFQHEQSAAMAADAIWRTNAQVGVTMATSGPGATNLITGIACSWFDSIPSFHITGQVNATESASYLGAKVRQAGFQETDIVGMVSSITKLAKQVTSVKDLSETLLQGYKIAISGRRGPVLIDIPMNVQKETMLQEDWLRIIGEFEATNKREIERSYELSTILSDSIRPLILLGGGLVSGGRISEVQKWCQENKIPFVTSWSAMSFVDRSDELYLGSIGVYGGRLANWAVQACDYLISLGSRLDNRQRTANPNGFAPFAKKIAFDIDEEELVKLGSDYEKVVFDLSNIDVLTVAKIERKFETWLSNLSLVRQSVSEGMEAACEPGGLNPYDAVRNVQEKLKNDAIVVSDCGANLCWVYQSFLPSNQLLFTAAGNSPMGYSLPAAIGASFANPNKQIACFIGDGGLQMNIQELQTVANFELPLKIFIQNNSGYGIIKQFQDSYFESRYHATGKGYSLPSFEKIAWAYGISYQKCESVSDIRNLVLDLNIPQIIELVIPEGALITPKVEMDRFVHDQFPYVDNPGINLLPYKYPLRPSQLESGTRK
jgi:acetolactate synthase-1/2/3 large subunit